MESEQDKSERLQRLLLLQLDGDPGEAGNLELAELLRDAPDLQQQYVEFIQDTASLRWWSAKTSDVDTGDSPQPIASTGLSHRRSMPNATIVAVLAASIILAVCIPFVINRR